MFKGTFSAQIVVSDLEKSLEFYTDVLGLELVEGPTEEISGSELSKAMRISDVSLRLALLKVGEEDLLELYEFINPKPVNDEAVPFNSIGASRVNFEVEDIKARKEELEAKGVEFYSPINDFDGNKWVFFSDPDGITLELAQPAE